MIRRKVTLFLNNEGEDKADRTNDNKPANSFSRQHYKLEIMKFVRNRSSFDEFRHHMARRATSSRGGTISREDDDHQHPHGRRSSSTAFNLSKLIDAELHLLEESFSEVKRKAEQVIIQINQARNQFEQLQGGERMEIEMELKELKKTVGKLKSKIPFNLLTPDDEPPNANLNLRPRSNPKRRLPMKHLDDDDDLNLDDIDEHPTLKDLRIYLDFHCRLPGCMFFEIFLHFPEKAILKKSLLAYWEEVIETASQQCKPDLPFLVSIGIIKPIYKLSNRTVSGFWMHPFVRSAFFRSFMKHEWRYHVNSIDEEEDVIYGDSPLSSAMKNLIFLHLGKSQSSSTQHIEMEDPNSFFKKVKKMDRLKYISFRGISMIHELPKAMKKFSKLQILDLRACYNLEAIPSDIGNIWKFLTHLDMSECYFLDHMPASLSMLHQLEVLKGFYVGESNNKETCTLQDLSSLRRLRKLNIYTSVKGFPNEDELTVLHDFPSLKKLTISWGGCSALREKCKSSPPEVARMFTPFKEFSFKLEKLDLQCVPNTVTRHWLKPSNFKTLETLYIRGGQFNDLGGVLKDQKGKGLVAGEDAHWSVETLRLKHLSELQMDWSELRHVFPNLVNLEKVQCPNLTSFPCDESGLWTKTTPPPPIPIPRYTNE